MLDLGLGFPQTPFPRVLFDREPRRRTLPFGHPTRACSARQDRGFGSEVNNLVSAAIACEEGGREPRAASRG